MELLSSRDAEKRAHPKTAIQLLLHRSRLSCCNGVDGWILEDKQDKQDTDLNMQCFTLS
jgi:hypothetical protein